jgi:hypothetical protein
MQLREAAGAVDGVNRDFVAPGAYEPGTLRALRNGRLLSRDLADGYVEVDPSLGTFRLRIAPRVGDNVFCFYVEI